LKAGVVISVMVLKVNGTPRLSLAEHANIPAKHVNQMVADWEKSKGVKFDEFGLRKPSRLKRRMPQSFHILLFLLTAILFSEKPRETYLPLVFPRRIVMLKRFGPTP